MAISSPPPPHPAAPPHPIPRFQQTISILYAHLDFGAADMLQARPLSHLKVLHGPL